MRHRRGTQKLEVEEEEWGGENGKDSKEIVRPAQQVWRSSDIRIQYKATLTTLCSEYVHFSTNVDLILEREEGGCV